MNLDFSYPRRARISRTFPPAAAAALPLPLAHTRARPHAMMSSLRQLRAATLPFSASLSRCRARVPVAPFSAAAAAAPKVGVLLAGAGVYDGSEVHEASAVLVHLSRAAAEVSIYAPDWDQMHVIDHTKGEAAAETRNVLAESARIARGAIAPLSALDAADHDALIVPGGFGAAKNLCDFAVAGADMAVRPEVEAALRAFHAAGKPIGLCCIAPVLA